jgi:transcriptional regulator with XRE-family HTH domain
MERTDLGEHVRKLRETYFRETQAEFAERLSLSRVAITRYETGERVPKRAVLTALMNLAAEKEYIPGTLAFSRVLGGRWELKHGAKQLTPVEAGADRDLFESAVSIYANWTALKPYVDTTDASARHWASSLDSELNELIQKLNQIAIAAGNG